MKRKLVLHKLMIMISVLVWVTRKSDLKDKERDREKRSWEGY